MKTAEILSLIPTLLAWAAVVYKLSAFRHNLHDPTIRAFWLSLLFLALALTVLLPSVALWIDRSTEVANLSRLLGNGAVVVAAWAVQIFVFRNLDYRGEDARSRISVASWALLTVLVAMTGLFILAPVHHEAPEFWQRYGNDPFMRGYRVFYLAYLGMTVVNIVRHSWRYAGIADQPSLSLGLRVVAVGGVLGGGYIAHEGLRAAATAVGTQNAFLDSDTVTRILIASSVAFLMAGVTMPAWGPHVGIPDLYDWLRRYRTYRQLYPLWRALHRSSPEIALSPSRSAFTDVLTVRDLDFRLYRRIVEIRDGSLELRPYIDARVIEKATDRCHAAGLSENETHAVIEAASIATALEARRVDRLPRTVASPLTLQGGADVISEAAVLLRVARCFQHSRIVHAVAREMRREARKPSSGAETPASRR